MITRFINYFTMCLFNSFCPPQHVTCTHSLATPQLLPSCFLRLAVGGAGLESPVTSRPGFHLPTCVGGWKWGQKLQQAAQRHCRENQQQNWSHSYSAENVVCTMKTWIEIFYRRTQTHTHCNFAPTAERRPVMRLDHVNLHPHWLDSFERAPLMTRCYSHTRMAINEFQTRHLVCLCLSASSTADASILQSGSFVSA